MYKVDLVLNNPRGLMCHQTQPTNTNTSAQSAGTVEYADCLSGVA